MTWNFPDSPSMKRSSFLDLLKRAPRDMQNRLADLLFSIVFKNELSQMLPPEDLGKFIGAEIKTTNFGSTWSIEFDVNGTSSEAFTNSSTPNKIVIPSDRPGYYRITIDGNAEWPRPQ